MYFELLDFMSWVFEASARHQTSPVLFVTLNHTAAEILEFRRQVLTGSLPQGLNVLEFPATYEVETPGFISKEIQKAKRRGEKVTLVMTRDGETCLLLHRWRTL
jgi:hypothetical protein